MPFGANRPEFPLRVLHVANGYMYGGVESALAMVARHRSLCPSMEPEFALCFDGRMAEELRATGVRVWILGNSEEGISRKALELQSGLADILDRSAYDAVICHMLMVQAIFGTLPRKRGILNLLHTHGVTPPVWEWWANQVPPDHLIYNSEHMRRTSSHLFQGVPGSVVYYPALPPDIEIDSATRRAIRAENGVGDTDLAIAHVARLEPMKGQRELLQAVSELKDLKNWVVWIVGGPQREHEQAFLEELRKLVPALGLENKVRFLGQRSDVPWLLRSADILCQPNLKTESFGMSFIEAEFAGLPVVTTAFGGALEAVGEGCGILVPPGDQAALVEALRTLLTKPALRERASECGPRYAARLCDPKTNLNRLYELLREEVESSARVLSTAHSASNRTSPGVSSTDRASDTDSTR